MRPPLPCFAAALDAMAKVDLVGPGAVRRAGDRRRRALVKPPPSPYHRPRSVEEAARLLAEP